MFVSDHPHARLLQRIYGELAESGLPVEEGPDQQLGGMELWERSIDEPFVCHCAGDSPVAGEFVGWEAMKAHAADFARLCDDSMTHDPVAIYAEDTWGLVPQIMSVSRKGRSITMPVAGGWRFSAPGRIAEHWEIVSDQKAWDEFWSA